MHLCNVCGKRQTPYFTYRKFKYFKCPICNLVSTYPLPSLLEMKKHYKRKFEEGNYSLLLKYDNEYRRIYQDFVNILIKQLKKHKKSIKGLSVLDVGCFTGTFLLMLKRKGFKVTGLELQQDAAEIANKRLQNRVYATDVITGKLPDKQFDIISLLGLVEHVVDPSKLIKKCEKVLSKDGLIIIQTPESSSIPEKLLKKYWPPYAPIEHIHLFSRKALARLLTDNGFEIVYSGSHIKKLPVSYVYRMLENFGPEFKRLLTPLFSVLPDFMKEAVLPFYIGEMIFVARKLPK